MCFVCIYVRLQAQACTVWIQCCENVLVAHEQAHTRITIHKPISYQVSSTDYLPFQYPRPAYVDSVIVLLFMSSLVLNICTKIHLIYLIIVSCPLKDVLIASLREKGQRGRERRRAIWISKLVATQTGEKSHPPIAVSFSHWMSCRHFCLRPFILFQVERCEVLFPCSVS